LFILGSFQQSCADTKVTNKTLFPTFARTSLGPPEKISKSVIALLKAYQWKKFIIVADTRQWTKEITLAVKVNNNQPIPNEFN
jgi:guanylate cyclase, other